jgi:hypothetical protein
VTDVPGVSDEQNERVGFSYEQETWLAVSQMIEAILLRGFTGTLELNCRAGVVMTLDKRERHDLEKERRAEERRSAPRDGEDRRRKE